MYVFSILAHVTAHMWLSPRRPARALPAPYVPLRSMFLLPSILLTFFPSFLLAFPLPKWILISHYSAQKPAWEGIGQKCGGDEGNPPAMNTTICVQSLGETKASPAASSPPCESCMLVWITAWSPGSVDQLFFLHWGHIMSQRPSEYVCILENICNTESAKSHTINLLK